MRRRILALAGATFLAIAGASHAADIEWSVGPSFGGADGHLGILTNGTLVAAVHTRGSTGVEEIVDPMGLGLAFTPIDSPSFGATFTDPPNEIGDPVWSEIVASFEWQKSADVTAPAFLTGLTPGNVYQVQLFAGRSHPCCGARSQRFGDGNGHFSPEISFEPLHFVSIVGTFVADATTQTLVFDDSTENPLLSAYVLRDVTGLPEPEAGGWAVAAGLAAVRGHRSRISRRRAGRSARGHASSSKEDSDR